MKSMVLWISVALLAISAPASASPRPYSGIVVFGTSLSDPGNGFAVYGEFSTPQEFIGSDLLVPSAPYARGGLHVSNGAPWIVQFARPLGLGASVQAAYRDASPEATNYAVIGARASNNGIDVNLADQLSRFVDDQSGIAGADRLYVVEMGGNDVFDALQTFLGGGDGGPTLQAALSSIATALTQLRQMGATHFLVANVPDVSLTPAVRTVNALYSPQTNAVLLLASSLVKSFNTNLDAIVAQTLSGADVARLDIYGRLNDIVASPADFGLTNVISPCITPNEPPFTCQKPDEYVFWDGIHPTKAVHAIFAHEAEVALGL